MWNKTYTLVEKFFKIEPEMTITRLQFFARFLIPGLVLFFLPKSTISIIMIGYWFSENSISNIIFILFLVTLTLTVLLIWYIGYISIIKRCKDIGRGETIVHIFYTTYIGIILLVLFAIPLLLGVFDIPKMIILILINVTQFMDYIFLISWISMMLIPSKWDSQK